jgi:hypothetical protein
VLLAQVWTYSLFFTFSAICLNFQQQNMLKNQDLPHLSSENLKTNSVKSNSPRAFQQHQEHPQIPIQFAVSILFRFHWENDSIINSIHTVAPKSLQPSQCTHTHLELSEDTKSLAWSAVIWEISVWQTKQNKLPCFMDRLFIDITNIPCLN